MPGRAPRRRRRPRAAGRPQLARASRRSRSATGCCAPAAGSPAGPTRCSSSATRRSRPAGRRRRRRPAGTPTAASGRAPRSRCPEPRRPTPRSPPPGWTRDEDNLVLTAPLDGWPAPAVAGRPRPGARRRLARRLPLPRHAAARRWPAPCWSTPTTRCSPRSGCDPAPAPLAAVARGVLVDGWLCVTAVTVDERHRRRGLATAVMAGARRLGPRARRALLPACRSPATTRRRWPSTRGWASPSTTATTTGWVRSRLRGGPG